MPSAIFSEADAERFWKFVARGNQDDCWEWMGSRNGNTAAGSTQYGQFRWQYHSLRSHRVAWSLSNGQHYPGPEVSIMHTCDNPACCNPSHLRAGTHAENMADRSQKGRHPKSRITHCPKGHPYDAVNTYFKNDGRHRECRTCRGSLARRPGVGNQQISDETMAGLLADAAAGLGGRRLSRKWGVSTSTAYLYQLRVRALPTPPQDPSQ